MPQSRCHVGVPEHGNILPGVVQVIVKTPDIQSIFEVANDTSVKQFKERLSAHFNCQLEQLELVFMGRLLKDHDTLSQRGIRDGHTIYVVIKSKHGSRSLAHPFRNLLTNSPCHQDRSTKGNSSRVFPSAGMSQTKVESPLLMKSDAPNVGTQNPDVESPEHIAQMLENLCVQTLLSNMGQLNSEYPDIQELIQHNPGASLLLDNSEILCQTLELARRLAIIREIMQIRRPAQNFEHPLNPQPYVGLEMIPNEAYGLGQSYDNLNDQMFSGTHDLLEDNSVTTLLAGQVVEQVQTPLLSPSPPEEPWGQFPTAHVIYADSCGLPSTNPTQAAPDNVSHASGGTPATAATTGQSRVCTVQQPAGIPALSSIAVTKELQEDGKGTTTSLGSSDQGVEDLQQSDEQTIAQITGGMIQLLRNHPFTAAQMLLLMNLPQLNEQWRQQPPASLQPLQLSELLSALANPKASQAILQIEHGLQLLATEAPVLLPCIESYLWSLGWFPPSSCSYPDPMPWAWNVPDTAEPQWPECCHKPGTVLQRLQPLSGDSSQSQQAPEVHFRKQMECLQAMGFVNCTANLQALIATDGDMNAAIQKLKRPQGL